jgi:hypothetical protein
VYRQAEGRRRVAAAPIDHGEPHALGPRERRMPVDPRLLQCLILSQYKDMPREA